MKTFVLRLAALLLAVCLLATASACAPLARFEEGSQESVGGTGIFAWLSSLFVNARQAQEEPEVWVDDLDGILDNESQHNCQDGQEDAAEDAVEDAVEDFYQEAGEEMPQEDGEIYWGEPYYNTATAPGEMAPMLELKQGGRFELRENLYEAMGTYTGYYQIYGEKLVLEVEETTFLGFAGDDVTSITFLIKDKSTLILQQDLCYSRGGHEFVVEF